MEKMGRENGDGGKKEKFTRANFRKWYLKHSSGFWPHYIFFQMRFFFCLFQFLDFHHLRDILLRLILTKGNEIVYMQSVPIIRQKFVDVG